MSRHRHAGFTMVELFYVMAATSVIAIILYSLSTTLMSQYFKLQADSYAYSEIAANSQRIARVLRGAYGITAAQPDSVTLYSYFSPQDDITAVITYYLSGDQKKLLADVTPMTANPPLGTPITAQKRTVTIIDNFYKKSGVNTFDYLNSTGGVLSQPITDLNAIKGIAINLTTTPYGTASTKTTSTSLSVNLRNRKTNL